MRDPEPDGNTKVPSASSLWPMGGRWLLSQHGVVPLYLITYLSSARRFGPRGTVGAGKAWPSTSRLRITRGFHARPPLHGKGSLGHNGALGTYLLRYLVRDSMHWAASRNVLRWAV